MKSYVHTANSNVHIVNGSIHIVNSIVRSVNVTFLFNAVNFILQKQKLSFAASLTMFRNATNCVVPSFAIHPYIYVHVLERR